MFLSMNLFLIFVSELCFHTDFILGEHTDGQNEYFEKHGGKINLRGEPGTFPDPLAMDRKVCEPSKTWVENGETCVCSPDGSTVNCNNELGPHPREKRNVPSKEDEINCNCNCDNQSNFRNVNFCNCLKNFFCNCMRNFVHSMNHFCNCMELNNCTASNDKHNSRHSSFCCCFGNTGNNRRKQYRDQFDYNYCDSDQNSNVKQHNVNVNEYRHATESQRSSRTHNLKSKQSPNTEDCKRLDVKTLYKFCKMYMKATGGEHNKNAPQGLVDINTLLNFCETQVQDKKDKTSSKKNVYSIRRPNRKDFIRGPKPNIRKPRPTERTKKSQHFREPPKERPLRNISRTLVGDYDSDYSIGLDSADLKSFGMKADSRIREKVLNNIKRGRKDQTRKKKQSQPRVESDSSEELTYESLGLKFPVSRDEADSKDHKDSEYDEKKKNKKPLMNQIFDGMSLSDDEKDSEEHSGDGKRSEDNSDDEKSSGDSSDDETDSEEDSDDEEHSDDEGHGDSAERNARNKPKRARNFRNRPRKERKNIQRSNYFNPNNRAYKGAVNENKLKRAADKRNQRFNKDNSVDDEFVFEQSNDLLHFSI